MKNNHHLPDIGSGLLTDGAELPESFLIATRIATKLSPPEQSAPQDKAAMLEEQKQAKSLFDEKHISFNIPYSDLSFPEQKKLGKGAQGTVTLGSFKQETVAVKHFPVDEPDAKLHKDILSEAKIMASIQSDFVTSLRAVCLESGKYCLVMEYLPEGDLYKKVNETSLTESQIYRLAADISIGLGDIHKAGILHRDLKGLNVLLYEANGELRAKITDFGLSILKRYLIDDPSAPGSVPWMAPEILSQNDSSQFSEASDVFSLGMVLFELVSRKVPYFDLPDEKAKPSITTIREWIIAGKRPWENLPKECPHALVNIIKECCNQDPKARPDLSIVQQKLELLYEAAKHNEQQASSSSNGTEIQPPSSLYSEIPALELETLGTLSSNSAPESPASPTFFSNFCNNICGFFNQKEPPSTTAAIFREGCTF